MRSLRLELLGKPSYQVRRAQLMHKLHNSKTKRFKNTGKLHVALIALAMLKGRHAMN